MNIWPVSYKTFELLHVVLIDSFRIGEVLGYVDWNHYLIDGTVRVWRDNSSSSKIYSLTRQVLSETTMLPLKPLAQGSYCFVS